MTTSPHTLPEPSAWAPEDPGFRLGDTDLHARIILGTARYPSRDVLLASLAASGAEMATVSLRRVAPQSEAALSPDLYTELKDKGYRILPNTAGCFTAAEAILTAELAREALETNFIKVEIIACREQLLPDTEALLKACAKLCDKGFTVLPYTNDDPIVAERLADLGCAAVMPLASPIGSGLGIRNPHNLELIRRRVEVPIIVDAGLGTASDVTLAMELGCDAVLMNTAVARAHDPVSMAWAMGFAARAGYAASRAGRIPKRELAEASSPLSGVMKMRQNPEAA